MEKLHIQPSELDMLPYYEYEYMIELYNEIVTARNDKEQSDTDVDKYNNNTAFKAPKQPKLPSFKTPNLSGIKF